MKRLPIFPNGTFLLDDLDPAVQLLVIDLFRSKGLPVFEGTLCQDPEYQLLGWDNQSQFLTQYKTTATHPRYPLKEFLEKFFTLPTGARKVELNPSYTAVVEGGQVKVGCQTFPYSVIEQLYQVVQEQKKSEG